MMKEGVFDEVTAIRDHLSPVDLFLGEEDSVVNIDYINLLKIALGKKLNLKTISHAGHYLHLESAHHISI